MYASIIEDCHPQGSWVVKLTPDGMPWVDERLAAALGYELGELEGRSMTDPDLVHPDDLQRVSTVLDALEDTDVPDFHSRWLNAAGEYVELCWFFTRWLPGEPSESLSLVAVAQRKQF